MHQMLASDMSLIINLIPVPMWCYHILLSIKIDSVTNIKTLKVGAVCQIFYVSFVLQGLKNTFWTPYKLLNVFQY